MFTLQQLKAAHAKVKTGADFPRYVHEISSLGLRYYEFMVRDGMTIYHGDNDHLVKGVPIYEPQNIHPQASAADLQNAISIHQQGQTDFLTFCRQAAEAGVEKWVIDTRKMVCIYLDNADKIIVEEPIPAGDYN